MDDRYSGLIHHTHATLLYGFTLMAVEEARGNYLGKRAVSGSV